MIDITLPATSISCSFR